MSTDDTKSPIGVGVQEQVQIVDSSNRPVCAVARHQMRAQGLIHRATYIFVLSCDRRLYAQKRTASKDLYPSYWDLAAGGVVTAGEAWDDSARRELHEELGIEGVALEPGIEFFYQDANNRCFGRTWHCVHDGPFRLQPEEVVELRLLSMTELRASVVSPITPDTQFALERWLASDARVLVAD